MKQRDEKKETRKLPMGRRGKRLMVIYAALVLMMTAGATTVFAADDPLTVINNLSEFIFGLIRAIGMILLGFGIVQIGLSLKSHDPSQRANGFLTLAGGVIITFDKKHPVTGQGDGPETVCPAPAGKEECVLSDNWVVQNLQKSCSCRKGGMCFE